jgi:amino acid adenylation domain-containing protein
MRRWRRAPGPPPRKSGVHERAGLGQTSDRQDPSAGTPTDPKTRLRAASGAYGLSPMQGGMLFQYLLSDGAAERGGYDVEQIHVQLNETLEPGLLAQAWTHVASRHPILSTSFRWENVERPEQQPIGDVTVPLEVLDWRSASEAELPKLRAEFLARDRKRSFDLRQAPLLRVSLCSLADGQRSEMFWTFHHILLDGRSFAAVLAEVFDVYAKLARGEVLARGAATSAPRPYVDYIDWLARHDGHDGTASRAFFKTLLRGKFAPTPLPCAEPAARPLPRSGSGVVARYLSDETARALREFAKTHQTTVATLVQAAWSVLLSRLTGDDDVIFGVIRSARRSALDGDAENMVGLFINSLPLRVRVDGQQTIDELLSSVRATSVALRAHDQSALIDIQGQSDLPRGMPLFETLLMYENRELNHSLRDLDPRWNERTCTLYEQPALPLTLIVVDDQRFEMRFLFDKRRFRDGVAERISEYLETTLEALLRTPRVGEIEVLPARERKRILFDWNDTPHPFSDQARIHELFESRADQQPDAIALEIDGQTLTFAELETRANRIANVLRAQGALPGRYVGVCLSRSLELVVTLIGVAKSGAAYVPLDAEYPRDRIAFMLEDAKAALVITEHAYSDRFSQPVLLIDSSEFANAASTRPAAVASASDPCYAIYTSGSTGKPKGVVLTHRAVINTLEWISRSFEVQPGDRLLFVTSPCFDLSVYDTFGALGAGATVVIASSECMREPRRFVDSIIEQRITIWDSAPAALQRLAPFFPSEGGSHLRLVMLSGDWIPLSLPDDVRRSFPRAQVKSLGGATEAAIWSNWYPIGDIDPRWTSIPYGRPIQNSHYHVLDKQMRPVPIGVPGDLYIGGTCLAQGYLNRAELTAERFVSDPFRPGGRLYMTGDLARYFDDGVLEFLGRADFQVKIRGYRVELGEVEAAIAAVPGVREVLCSAFVDASGQKALVAYVVPKSSATLEETEIKRRVGANLPDFMVPSQIILLAAMPVSANGKVDRKALPDPTQRAVNTEYVEARGELEIKMVAIWEDLLQREHIGVTDNFFALGGQSLLAVMLVSRLERELGVRIPLSRVLERPTVEGLAASLERTTPESRHLVTLGGGDRAPLVLVAGIGGFGFIFQGLGSWLGNEQALHVLHAVGAEDEREGSDHSIEEVASIYEPQVLAACPTGPIVLGGYSFGILVALELALRLERAGREVPLLISFDGFAPGFPKLLPAPQRLVTHMQEFARRDLHGRNEYIRERLRNVRKRFRSKIQDEVYTPPAALDDQMQERLRRVAAGLWKARDKYRPAGRAACDVLLLKASIPFDWSGSWTDPLYGWRGFVRGRIDTMVVPGEHLQLFRPENEALMAEFVRRRLRELAERRKP